MRSASVGTAGAALAGERLAARVSEQGSAAHPYLSSEVLRRGSDVARDLADAVHLLCMLHGRHPGVIDHAANRTVEAPLRAWFNAATLGFAAERALLARLAVAAGPMPSTPGAGDNQAAVLGQRHAIEMLAQSERNGCALGAALALALDWVQVRPLLELSAARFGVDCQPYAIAKADIFAAADAAACGSPAVERALMFGAEQIAVQHFGLWDLLEARQQARAAS
jgi:hypothetical protein